METEQTTNEKEARRLNILEDTQRIRKWAKSLTDERIKNLLTEYRADCRRIEIKVLIAEENRRRNK